MEGNGTVDLNNTGSLDLMHDILVPPAISFWPLASGWYLVLALLLAFVLHKAFQMYRVYQSNLYRREALAELVHLKSSVENEKAALLLGLMKRVALQHFGRDKVAALSHDAWWDFMESHSKVKIEGTLRKYTQSILYDANAKHDSKQIQKLESITATWIKTHQGEEA